jgi:hypothetical protein
MNTQDRGGQPRVLSFIPRITESYDGKSEWRWGCHARMQKTISVVTQEKVGHFKLDLQLRVQQIGQM